MKMKAINTEFGKKYATYHSNGIFTNWNDGWEILTNESAIELNNILAEFIAKKAKWKTR